MHLHWPHFSLQAEPARDFIRAALNKDASKRPTMHQLLRHNWLRAYQVGQRSLSRDASQHRNSLLSLLNLLCPTTPLCIPRSLLISTCSAPSP